MDLKERQTEEFRELLTELSDSNKIILIELMEKIIAEDAQNPAV